jgi:hypothetical protein
MGSFVVELLNFGAGSAVLSISWCLDRELYGRG